VRRFHRIPGRTPFKSHLLFNFIRCPPRTNLDTDAPLSTEILVEGDHIIDHSNGYVGHKSMHCISQGTRFRNGFLHKKWKMERKCKKITIFFIAVLP